MRSDGTRMTTREKQRHERKQDLKYIGIIVVAVGVASLIFYPYARDIWAVFLGISGLLIMAIAALRIFEVFGFVRIGWHAETWNRAHGSGWLWTALCAVLGFAMMFLAGHLSERTGGFFKCLAVFMVRLF